MFQIDIPNPVFNLKTVVLLFIPKAVLLRVVTSVDLLFILLTVQLTISEINELHWILNTVAEESFQLKVPTPFLRSVFKYSFLLDSFPPLVQFFSLAVSCK